MSRIKICIATSNAHKISEFREMFANAKLDCDVFGAGELSGFEPPEEDGKTFSENALIKARAAAKIAPKSCFIMADDSGLCVDFLGGEPGVMSARYAGVKGDGADAANNKKLLKNLEGVPMPDRTARFVCAIALECPNGIEKVFTGKIEGVIDKSERGERGFGYDPLFLLPERGKTTAELTEREKNSISHRGKAFSQTAEFIKSQI